MDSVLPHRYETDEDYRRSHPVTVVWELTLACNLRCTHCGSRAGRPRRNELSLEECVDVIRQLAELGTREIALIGGEAYLRTDWLHIVRAISDHGIHASMQTGGRALTREKVRKAAEAGLKSCGVSIDGLKDLHDRLRGVPGSFDQAVAALGHLKEYGIPSSVNTQITADTLPDLRPLLKVIAAAGATNWQIQLTVAMGNAVDNSAILLQPYELAKLMPLLAELYEEALDLGVLMQPGNNIGYFGPYENLWRVTEDSKHWQGCSAGHTGLGLEADGTVKGCPSLPTKAYSGGNVRTARIAEIWKGRPELRFTRDRSTKDLWGYCKTCYYADVCRAGCTWTSHSLLGRPGNNPYCHYRVLKLAESGLRERVEKIAEAPGQPFDSGQFALILEPLHGGVGTVQQPPAPRIPVRRKGSGVDRVPPQLRVCRSCDQYVLDREITCPHCGADIAAAEGEYEKEISEVQSAIRELRRAMENLEG